MNFKDAYNSMTDEIHGNRALLHSILNGEAKKKRRFAFSARPVFGAALAAMFMLTTSTLYFKTGINDFTHTSEKGISVGDVADQKNNLPNLETNAQSSDKINDLSSQSLKDKDNHNSSESAGPSHSPASETAKENSVLPEDTKTKSLAKNNAVYSDDKKSVSGSSPRDNGVVVPDLSVSQPQVESDKTSSLMEDNNYVEENAGESAVQIEAQEGTNLPVAASSRSGGSSEDVMTYAPASGSSSGGGGGSSSVAGIPYDGLREEYMTASQYWSYIGEDLSQKADLPDGYSLIVPAGVEISYNGNTVVSDVLTMTATSSSGNTVVISVSKETNLDSLYSEAAHSTFDGVNVAVESQGLSQSQIDQIILSLTE